MEAQGGSGQVLAVVNGKPITEAEVRKSAADQFKAVDREYEQQVHDLLESSSRHSRPGPAARGRGRRAARSTKEAASRRAQARHGDRRRRRRLLRGEQGADPPSRRSRSRPQIKSYLEQQGQTEGARQVLQQTLEEPSTRSSTSSSRSASRWPPTVPPRAPRTRPITIVEFSDFQCPFCSRVIPTLKQVEEKYGDKVRVVFRQYPLPFHQNAQKAAEAVALRQRPGQVLGAARRHVRRPERPRASTSSRPRPPSWASTPTSSTSASTRASTPPPSRPTSKAGAAAGVSGTPALFINGRVLNGAVPFDADLTTIIDDELRRSGGAARPPPSNPRPCSRAACLAAGRPAGPGLFRLSISSSSHRPWSTRVPRPSSRRIPRRHAPRRRPGGRLPGGRGRPPRAAAVRPGEVRRLLPAAAPEAAEPIGRHPRRLPAADRAQHHPLEPPRLPRLLRHHRLRPRHPRRDPGRGA